MSIDFSVTRTVPRDTKAVGIGVFTEGAVGRALGIDRAGLTALGFEGKPGQAYILAGGAGPTRVALGLGAKGETTVSDLRKSAAAFARAPSAGSGRSRPASSRPRVSIRRAVRKRSSRARRSARTASAASSQRRRRKACSRSR